MGSIVFDSRSGDLVEGIVWQFIPVPDRFAADDRGHVWAESGSPVYASSNEISTDPTREADSIVRELNISLFGGAILGDFLPLFLGGETVVSRRFANQLRASSLTGFALRPGVRVVENQSQAVDPEFLFFDIVGRGGYCRRWRIEDAPNLCPYCRKAPILRSDGGWSLAAFLGCPSCGQRVHHGGGYLTDPDGQNLHFAGDSAVAIVEGRDWDGSDFLNVEGMGGGWFVTQRAKEWLEASGTLDIEFTAALLNVEGLKPGYARQ